MATFFVQYPQVFWKGEITMAVLELSISQYLMVYMAKFFLSSSWSYFFPLAKKH
jgi:hypothetical protein